MGMMPLSFPEVVMNTRSTDVSWDPTLVRVEYLDDAGTPYYCSFKTRDRAWCRAPKRFGNGADYFPADHTERQAKVLIMVTITVFVEKESQGKGPRE
jgi:hypothetical protein